MQAGSPVPHGRLRSPNAPVSPAEVGACRVPKLRFAGLGAAISVQDHVHVDQLLVAPRLLSTSSSLRPGLKGRRDRHSSPSAGGSAPPSSPSDLRNRDRAFLASASRLLPRKRWASFCVTPQTLLRWHRALVARKSTYRKSGKPGRPPIDPSVVEAVVRLARENPRLGLHDNPR